MQGSIVRRLGALAAAVLATAGIGSAAHAADVHPGQAVYDRSCAACHNAPEPGSRAAPVASLRQMDARTLRTSLTTGVMKGIGDSLSPEDLRAVVDYLAAKPKPVSDDWIEGARCPADRRSIDITAPLPSGSFGISADNRRRLTAAQSGLTTASLARLQPAWTLAIPNATTMRSQPVLLGSTLFYAASQASTLLALDAGTGCIKWAAKTPSGIRTSLALGRLGKGGPLAVVGGDEGGHLQAWEAATGKLIWRADPRHDKGGVLTGAPVFAGEKLIVPISALDVAQAMRPTFACCSTHGAVSAVDAANGKVLWTWHATPDARPLGVKNSAGVEMMGPSGAPVWSTPAVDLKRGLVLTATGENTSPPATGTSDAIIALDLATGREKWVFQALANDVWNMSCPSGRESRRKPGPNCFFFDSDSVLRDHDFGGGPVIFPAGGRTLVLAGQKSGDVWALDLRTGRKVWTDKFGPGTPLGGVHWGIAADETRVFAPIADPGVPEPVSASGVHALDAATGKRLWSWRALPDCSEARKARGPGCERAGISAPPLVVDGAVLAAGLDGRLWVLDAASGKVLAGLDTLGPQQSLNGLPARGGSIDSGGLYAGGGMVFVGSGYAAFGQPAGNALIAFRPTP
jgi:polyvinyl alcohol dehydrogenase (cytochrome)